MKMKKKQIIILAAAAVAVTAIGCTVGVCTARSVKQAEQAHSAVYEEYRTLLDMTEQAVVTVSEGGRTVGSYGLDELGVLEAAQAEVTAAFSETDRMDTDAFGSLSWIERLRWDREAHPENVSVALPMEGFDAGAVMDDLAQTPRQAAQDARMTYENGAYQIHPEQYGNELREDAVSAGLEEQAAQICFAVDGTAAVSFEVTDTDCYLQPEITVENGGFDPAQALEAALAEMEIRVQFHSGEEVLAGQALSELVVLGEDGILSLAQDKAQALLDGWAQAYNVSNTPYLFESYAGGVVPIEFLSCDYELKTDELCAALWEQILTLSSGTLEAPYACYDRKGQPFGIENTYVEVDIKNQKLTYYKDGELIVHTDVVTGRQRDRRTPTGLYSSYDKRVNRWLVGSDYCVFVKYWIRFWNAYGIHDASWRDTFGGDQYILDGSHGCVNTPDEAMATLHENIEDGTPVLVFDASTQ